jgi:hypothetical protein
LSVGETGQRLAVVELELLQQREVGLLRLFEAGEHGPHRGGASGVRGDVLAGDVAAIEVLLVDLDFVAEARL